MQAQGSLLRKELKMCQEDKENQEFRCNELQTGEEERKEQLRLVKEQVERLTKENHRLKN